MYFKAPCLRDYSIIARGSTSRALRSSGKICIYYVGRFHRLASLAKYRTDSEFLSAWLTQALSRAFSLYHVGQG